MTLLLTYITVVLPMIMVRVFVVAAVWQSNDWEILLGL